MKTKWLFGMMVVLAVAFSAARADFMYALDDGVAETGLVDNHADAFLLNGFTADPSRNVITAIQVSIGYPNFNQQLLGHAITLAVWQDGVSQDGNPSDATVLAQFLSAVTNININADDNNWGTYTLPTPVAVTGKFFVGYMISVVDSDGTGNQWTSMSVAQGDTTTPQHQSWLAEASNGTGLSYMNNLGGADLTPIMNMDDLNGSGFPLQNFMIRAVAVPEPAAIALLLAGLISLLAWRRRV